MLKQEEMLQVIYEEAFASCRYKLYAEEARKEGLYYYAKVLDETARNELSHVRELMRMMGMIDSTAENLKVAITNESKESTDIYPRLREEAIVDGDLETARLFQQIAKVEARHRERFEALYNLLIEGKAFLRDTEIRWKCKNCGYIHIGTEPPGKCPACQSVREYFEPDDFAV